MYNRQTGMPVGWLCKRGFACSSLHAARVHSTTPAVLLAAGRTSRIVVNIFLDRSEDSDENSDEDADADASSSPLSSLSSDVSSSLTSSLSSDIDEGGDTDNDSDDNGDEDCW